MSGADGKGGVRESQECVSPPILHLLHYSNGPVIGEGTHSTNQRSHTYVRDHVEVGFFTDPTVCIGCKACEVACKEWNR